MKNGTTTFSETAASAKTFIAAPMTWVSAPNGHGIAYPGSGTITTENGIAHVKLTGAAANTTYDLTVSYMGGSSSYEVGTFATDANGNATADLNFANSGAGAVAIFSLSSPNGGFASGFRVP